MSAKILIVTEFADVNRSLAQTMNEEGYFVETASTAQEGLELIRKQRPDVVLLDVDLEGLGGMETVIKLRADHPSMQMIIVHKYEAARYGFDGLGCMTLIKPPSFERILISVKHAIATARV